MPYFHVFLWDGLNDDHVAEHGISTEEFEYVVLNASIDAVKKVGRAIG